MNRLEHLTRLVSLVEIGTLEDDRLRVPDADGDGRFTLVDILFFAGVIPTAAEPAPRPG